MDLDLQSLVQKLRDGQEIENPKLEIKRQWYKLGLSDSADNSFPVSEFLKDLVALANTPGPTGYLVIGIQEDGVLFDAPFKSCGLDDESKLRSVVVRRVAEPVTFELSEVEIADGEEKKVLSVLTVPPSLSKPHVISHYTTKRGHQIQNFIPIRKGTSVNPANKYDLEHMIYDRKNIEPEYALDILVFEPRIVFNPLPGDLEVTFQLVLQNYGRKPVAIVAAKLIPGFTPPSAVEGDFEMYLEQYDTAGNLNQGFIDIKSRFLSIGSNELIPLQVKFRTLKKYPPNWLEALQSRREFNFTIKMMDINGNVYSSGEISGTRV